MSISVTFIECSGSIGSPSQWSRSTDLRHGNKLRLNLDSNLWDLSLLGCTFHIKWDKIVFLDPWYVLNGEEKGALLKYSNFYLTTALPASSVIPTREAMTYSTRPKGCLQAKIFLLLFFHPKMNNYNFIAGPQGWKMVATFLVKLN